MGTISNQPSCFSASEKASPPAWPGQPEIVSPRAVSGDATYACLSAGPKTSVAKRSSPPTTIEAESKRGRLFFYSVFSVPTLITTSLFLHWKSDDRQAHLKKIRSFLCPTHTHTHEHRWPPDHLINDAISVNKHFHPPIFP